MANHLSAKKSIRQTIKRRLINKSRISRIKTCIKNVHKAIANGGKDGAHLAFVAAQSELMRGVTKGVIKLNTASRRISRLCQKIKKMA